MRQFLFPAAIAATAAIIAACAPMQASDTPTRAANIAETTLPPAKSFGAARPRAPHRSNVEIAQDFLDLHFELESGRKLERFTRVEGPITVRVTGKAPASLGPDLSRLLSRFRNEAGLNIHQVESGEATVTIEAVTRQEIRRALPHAACFVVPNVASLSEFRRARGSSATNWSTLTRRDRLAVFVPSDASPQEIRDCLHEEMAQALGPLNDLYRLPDSVFNDDNVHTVLTGFDMLVLRATYSPELQSGMSREQVAARLPAILNRLNPKGAGIPVRQVKRTPRAWNEAVQTALGPGATLAGRKRAASKALKIAREGGWNDHRQAFSHYMIGRMMQSSDPVGAQAHYGKALEYLDRMPGTELHRAYIVTQTAAFALVTGDSKAALKQVNSVIDTAARYENASLLSTLMLLKAEALDLEGRTEKARSVRLDSIGWARYGFGGDWAVRTKMREIAALNPQKRSDGQA